MKKISYIISILVTLGLFAQDKKALKYAKTITAEDLKEHLLILASDEYEGRETGTKGQRMAAQYIANHFKSLGLAPPVDGSYFQKFNLIQSVIRSVYMKKGDDMKIGFKDFIYYSNSETMGEEYINVVMASDENEMENFDGSYVVYVTEQLENIKEKIDKAKKNGAIGFIILITKDDEYNSIFGRFKSYLQQPSLNLNVRDNSVNKMIISNKSMASWIFEKKFEDIQAGETAQIIVNADYLDKPVSTENVLGFLKGTEKPDEVLVITSHYDHVGIIDGKIHNGADDDGSGTVTILELAEAFAKASNKTKRPKRSILFMTVTGEEKGLLGSKYYTDMSPVFPLANTVANLNIDMVGRVDETHSENPKYIYLIGSDKISKELHDLSEKVNNTYYNLDLDYTYNDENDPNRFYYRSDHYNFAKNNIPIIFYFNGTHADYHQPTDTVEKIEFKIMEKRARFIFHTGWEIANRKEKIKKDK